MTITTSDLRVHELPVDKCKVLISRARSKEEFDALCSTVRDGGVHIPITAVDMRSWTKDKRRNRAGVLCDYGITKGEGRWQACKKVGLKTVPAFLRSDLSPEEIVQLNWTENFNRQALKWAQLGRLIRDEVREGADIKAVAKSLRVSLSIAYKYQRAIEHAASEIEPEVAKLSINDAEVLTTIPARGQVLVMDLVRETGAGVKEVTREAKEVAKVKPNWTVTELKASLSKYDSDLEKERRKRKRLRIEWNLGPANLRILLASPEVRKALDSLRINYARFEELMNR
jgi:ParB-like chromosome segregation protein Spo0J